MLRTAHYSPLASAIKSICHNWTYYNHLHQTQEAVVSAALLDLQPKQAYLQSLDRPDYPTEVLIAEDAEYAKEAEGPDPTLAHQQSPK